VIKGIFSAIMILISILKTVAQDVPVSVTGSYYHVPLTAIIEESEQKHDIKFFFEETTIEDIRITGNFSEVPLTEFLGEIFSEYQVYFHISQNHIILFKGKELAQLFPGSQNAGEYNPEIPQLKMSKDKSEDLQYKIFNVGTPGNRLGRTAILSGHLKHGSNDPVAGANIYVTETGKGVTSDENGFYRIVLTTGNQIVNFSCVGMDPVKRNINLYSDGILNVEMEVKLNLLGGAEILGKGEEGKIGQVSMGMEKIDISIIRSIPALLGESDVLKSVLALPGVQTVGEGTSGFNVRGGSTDQNLILIDQATIYYPSHFFGNFSAINSDIIENATLYKGSMPVKYGGRISSVFAINTIKGNNEKISGSAGISPISARINLDGPLFSEKSTFVTSFRSTYSNWILGQIKVPELYKSKAGFNDFYLKTDHYINENNNLLISLYSSSDKFQLHSDTTYRYNNAIGSLILKHKYNARLSSGTSLVYSKFNYDIANKESVNQDFSLTHKLSSLSLINDFEYLSNKRKKYVFGAALNYYSVNPGERIVAEDSNILPVFSDDEHALEFGFYSGSEFNISGNLKVEAGIRLSGMLSMGGNRKFIYEAGMPYEEEYIIDTVTWKNNRIRKTYVNPELRFALNYSTGRYSSLKFSYNRTAQYIHMLSNTTAISPTDTWKLSDSYLVPETGHQFSTGYFKNFDRRKIKISTELFYKLVDNIKEYKAGADLLLNEHIETEIVNGRGKSYGAEFSVEKAGGRIYGRVDYTFSRTFFRSVSEFEAEMINDGKYFPANYDKPHSLNLLANLKASRRLSVSMNMVYSTGRPITYPVAKYMLDGQVFLQYSKYNQYRISDYFRTDLSVTLNGTLKKKQLVRSSLTLSLYNITGRKNAYSVYFVSEAGNYNAYKLSIFGAVIPTITYNMMF
jgi:hypothetical protein